MPIVVNISGAPGVGKSTGAAYIFAMLKMAGVNAELVTEFAKDKVWEQSKKVFEAQDYIVAKQHFRMLRCANQCDVLVTDSPLLLGLFYNQDPKLKESFERFVVDVFNTYDNVTYMILRKKPYNPIGRFQTESESDQIAEDMKLFYKKHNVPYKEVDGDKFGYDKIVSEVLHMLANTEKHVCTPKSKML